MWGLVVFFLAMVAYPAELLAGAPRLKTRRFATWAEYYGALPETICLKELEKRSIGYVRERAAPGVKIPVRLRGPIGGVRYRTDMPDAQRRYSPYEVFDCRLVLALSDFSRILRAHNVVEARIFSAWRPPPRNWPRGKLGTRHPGGLAVDIRELRQASGTKLSILEHFYGRLGDSACGPGADPPRNRIPEAYRLRHIVCRAADWKIFNSILTPNYDPPHANHFHLEVTPGVTWFFVH